MSERVTPGPICGDVPIHKDFDDTHMNYSTFRTG